MRSIPLMAATTVIVALAWACSDNGGGGTGPGAPTAAFSAPTTCTANAACQFTDASTPAGEITAWSWTFGDDPTAAPTTDQNPAHTYAAAGDYTVSLTVTSANGTSTPATHTVTVAAPANPAPTASFSVPACGVNVDCTFTSTSVDAGPPVGTIMTTHWNFGDAGSATNEADGVTVTHRYTTAGDKTVTLTVTDDGGATGTTSQTVSVQAAPASDCPATPGSATNVLCTLQLSATQKSQVKITMTSRDCELVGNRVTVQQPTRQDVFGNICTREVPPEYTVHDVNGATATFQPGAQLPIQFTRGDPRTGDPAAGQPVARVRGTFPDWTITIDDGGNPQGQNEPDFNDVILSVHATVVP